ncbi:MAG: hypothetical protein KAX49_01205 [Halanaerobiales bacterium]|nr:hypothetical protein [Halanaerobiales bacterium]
MSKKLRGESLELRIQKMPLFDQIILKYPTMAKLNLEQFETKFKSSSPIYKEAIPLYYPFIFDKYIMQDIDRRISKLMQLIFSISKRFFKNNINEMLKYLGYKQEERNYLLAGDVDKNLCLAKLFARCDFVINEGKLFFGKYGFNIVLYQFQN